MRCRIEGTACCYARTDHIRQIKQRLGISGVVSQEYTWFSPFESHEMSGAQIDLLIDRRDHVINLCEMKFSINEFQIDKEYDQALRNKIAAFRQAVNCKKTLQLTMVTTFGIKQGKYSGIVNNQVVLDDLFAL